MNPLRIIVYIDARNFEYGLKGNGWRNYFWLNLVPFFKSFTNSEKHILHRVKYFTAMDSKGYKAKQQDNYISANRINPNFDFKLGYYSINPHTCKNCQFTYDKHQEKQTDINIASHILSDFFNDECDITIIVSGDADLAPPVDFIKEFREKRSKQHYVSVFFPPNQFAWGLQQKCDHTLHLSKYERRFIEHQLPDSLKISDSIVINKPRRDWF